MLQETTWELFFGNGCCFCKEKDVIPIKGIDIDSPLFPMDEYEYELCGSYSKKFKDRKKQKKDNHKFSIGTCFYIKKNSTQTALMIL